MCSSCGNYNCCCGDQQTVYTLQSTVQGEQGLPGANVENEVYTYDPVYRIAPTGSSMPPGIVYVQQEGHWYQIGAMAFVQGRIDISSIGGLTDTTEICISLPISPDAADLESPALVKVLLANGDLPLMGLVSYQANAIVLYLDNRGETPATLAMVNPGGGQHKLAFAAQYAIAV